MRRQVDEYMQCQRQISMPPYVSEFPIFVPYTLTACFSAADILPAKPQAVADLDGRPSLVCLSALVLL